MVAQMVTVTVEPQRTDIKEQGLHDTDGTTSIIQGGKKRIILNEYFDIWGIIFICSLQPGVDYW